MQATLFDPGPRDISRGPARPPRPAAGVLLRFRDKDGAWYLLGRRCLALGGTWANIGGSLEPGEEPLVGALREFSEELGLNVALLRGAELAQTIDDHGDRGPYTLFVLDVPTAFANADLSWENDELWWFHADEVPTLDLHPGFRRQWAAVR